MIVDQKKPFSSLTADVDRRPGGSRWQSVRNVGRAHLRDTSFPGPKTEDWRFTNVAPILTTSFEWPATVTVDPTILPSPCAPNAVRLTFVNGAFDPKLSQVGNLGSGILLGHLSDPGTSADIVATHLGKIANANDQAFTALNTALLNDGAFLIVPANAVVDRPIEILYLTQPGIKAETAQTRTLVVLGRHAQATVVERFVGLGEGRAFTNAVAEIVLDEGAILDHVKSQQENLQTFHIANTQIVQARGSNFTTHSLLLGGALVRNEVRVRFDGEGCEATVNGLYLARGTQHVDSHTVIDHAKAHCNSHELYKGVLADKAHGVFNGKIFVRKDAQKTDAKQTNKVLLLSDDATINTKPQLEIFADDVKCTHGATIGQLDDNQIFYLRSRGIGLEEGRRLLTFAFANDVVSRIKLEAIRDEMEAILVGVG